MLNLRRPSTARNDTAKELSNVEDALKSERQGLTAKPGGLAAARAEYARPKPKNPVMTLDRSAKGVTVAPYRVRQCGGRQAGRRVDR